MKKVNNSFLTPQIGVSELTKRKFQAMVDAVRIVKKALGKVNYKMSEKEQASRVFRRSLFVVKDMKAGEEFTRKNVRSIRPGHRMPVKDLDRVFGRKAAGNLERGTPLSEKCIG